jgi:hypothetical protein
MFRGRISDVMSNIEQVVAWRRSYGEDPHSENTWSTCHTPVHMTSASEMASDADDEAGFNYIGIDETE